MNDEQLSDWTLSMALEACHRLRVENERLRAEIARQNIEMVAYREKLTPADAHAMKAVIDALYAAKRPADAGNGDPK
jgi:regulator of replication initiation timing